MALDPNKKFLYFNKDASSTESDEALCFPVSMFIGIEAQTSSILDFYFEGSKGVDATIVRVFHNQHAYIKTFMSSLVDEINFGEKAFVKVYDHSERTTYPSDVSINMGTDIAPVFTLEDATIDLGTVLSVEYGGTGANTLTADGVLFGNGTSAISAVDLSTNGNIIVGGSTPAAVTGANLAGAGLAATVGDGTLVLAVETLNQDTTGTAATVTGAAQTNITSLGTLTALDVDNISLNDKTITITGDTDDTFTIVTGAGGATTLTTVDTAAEAGHFEIAADGDITLDAANDIVLEGDDVSVNARSITQTNTQSAHGTSYIIQSRDDSAAVKNILQFLKDKGAAGADDDIIGEIDFRSDNSAEQLTYFAKIQAEVETAADTDEAGRLNLQVATSDGSTSALQDGIILSGHGTSDIIDATIGHGASSTTTIAGDLSVTTGLILDSVDVTTVQTSAESFADNDTSLMTSAAIDDRIAAAGGGVSVSDSTANTDFPVVFHDESNNLHDDTAAFEYNPSAGNLTVSKINGTTANFGKANVASEAQATIGMQIARRTITTAEANAMNSTPIEVVPAQGADTIIMPVNCLTRVDRAANQTNSACDMNAHYADKEPGTYLTASLLHWRRFMYGETTDHSAMRTPVNSRSGVTLTESVNKGIELSFDSAATTDCFTSIDIFMTYYIIDIS